MDRGDYRLAVAACAHVLETYPSCLTAHRMLGEAHLEQAQTDKAIQHFEQTIAVDPLNVVARLGLGVAAEEKREMGAAYAAYLHAWEINPALDQVRDELVRLRGLLGGDERLHPTRAGLAGIFARSGQFGRAAAEWRAVLAVEPDSRRARTSLAEVMWRTGDDGAAAAACREALRSCPENARALAMLADIERRRGNQAAAELIDRYQFVDPAGEIATLMAEWRDELDLSFLRRESYQVSEFDFSNAPVAERQSTVTTGATPGLPSSQFGAPDLWDSLVKDLSKEPGAMPGSAEDNVQPFAWTDDSMSMPGIDPFSLDAAPAAPEPASLPADIVIPAQQAPAQTVPFAANEPFSVEPFGATQAFGANVTASLEDQVAMMSGTVPLSNSNAMAAGATMQLGGPAMTAQLEREPARMPEPSYGAPMPPAAPVATAPVAPAPPKKREENQFVTADGRVDLTVGWDDLDRELRDATPNFENSSEFDALAAELGVDGIMPFDMGENPFESEAWAPFTDEDLGVAPAPAAPVAAAPVPEPVAPPAYVPPAPAPAPVQPEAIVPPVPAPAPELAMEWGQIDDELISSIPQQQSSGYTDLLRHVDIEIPVDVSIDNEIDTFISPGDASGVPLAFEDLLAVTSVDGTAPLVAPANFDLPGSAPEPFVELSENDVFGTSDDELEALFGKQGIETAFEPQDSSRNAFAGFDSQFDTGSAANLGVDDALVAQTPVDTFTMPEAVVESAIDAAESDARFDAMMAELGDLQPFALDDAAHSAGSGGEAVDFSDINEAPFDPATLQGIIAAPAAAAPAPVADNGWAAVVDNVPAVGAAPAVAPAVVTDAEPLAATNDSSNVWDALAAPATPAPVAVPAAAGVFAEHVPVATPPVEPAGFGLAPNGVAWPAFVNQTSTLIDRDQNQVNLFVRLREEKRTAVSAGLLTVDRSLKPAPVVQQVIVAEAQPEAVQPAPEPVSLEKHRARLSTLTEEQRLDLMAMRIRLIEDDTSAAEVAKAIEAAIARGINDPLAARVLGEAYLKLGRTEQAAAQFRHAMMARQRAR